MAPELRNPAEHEQLRELREFVAEGLRSGTMGDPDVVTFNDVLGYVQDNFDPSSGPDAARVVSQLQELGVVSLRFVAPETFIRLVHEEV